MEKPGILILLLLCLLGCNRVDEGPEVIAEIAAKIPDDIGSNRGERNCELFDLSIWMIS